MPQLGSVASLQQVVCVVGNSAWQEKDEGDLGQVLSNVVYFHSTSWYLCFSTSSSFHVNLVCKNDSFVIVVEVRSDFMVVSCIIFISK